MLDQEMDVLLFVKQMRLLRTIIYEKFDKQTILNVVNQADLYTLPKEHDHL
jgi:hypothetical protein